MRLYGSLDNRLAENTLQPVPQIMMGATVTLYSDRHAYTVREVSEETVMIEVPTDRGIVKRFYPKWIKASRDIAKVVEGSAYNGSARYEYQLDDLDKAELFIFHKPSFAYRKETKNFIVEDNRLVGVGTGRTKMGNQIIILGRKEEYFDPSF